jgi:Fic family protein
VIVGEATERNFTTVMENIDNILQQYRSLRLSEVIDYDKFNDFAITHHSTGIEGSTLTATETRLLLDEGLTPKGKPLIHSLMVRDHYEALRFVITSADHKKPISTELIQQINAHVMRQTGTQYHTVLGTVDSSKGAFRKGNVSAGGSYFPSYQKVEDLTKELVTAINKKLEDSPTVQQQLELSFAAHFNLVSIHPFYDGNGRTSRLLMNYLQLYYGLPMAIVFKEDKGDYFNALTSSRKEESLSPFYVFMWQQYHKFLQQQIQEYETVTKKMGMGGKNLLF